MKKLITIVLLLFSIFMQAQSWSQKMANTVMTIWKDSMTQGRPARWTYEQGVVLKGIEGLWKKTKDKKYFDYIQKSMDLFVQEDGSKNVQTG
jgi:unsaturated rhamnogalacturonyl hydrolase